MSSSSEYQATKGRQIDIETMATTGHLVLRRSGGGADASSSNEADGEVRQDLLQVDSTQTDREGSYKWEGFYSKGVFETAYEEVMGRVAVPEVTVTGSAGDISSVAATNRVTSTATDKFIDLSPGMSVELKGFSGVTLPGGSTSTRYFGLILSKPDNQTLALDPDTVSLADDTPAGATAVLVQGEARYPGKTPLPVTIEEKFQDSDYQSYVGLIGSSINWNRPATGKITCSADYMTPMGLPGQAAPATSIVLTAAAADPPATRIMSHAHVNLMIDDEGVISLRTQGTQYTLSRTISRVPTHGTIGDVDKVLGTLEVTGSFDIVSGGNAARIAATHRYIDLWRNDEPTKLLFFCSDPDGNVESHFFPRILYSSAARNPGGPNQVVGVPLPFRAITDLNYGFPFCKQSWGPA